MWGDNLAYKMFDELDFNANANCRYWQTSTTEEYQRGTVLTGKLSEVGAAGILRTFVAYLSNDSLFCVSESTGELFAWTVLRWKVLNVLSDRAKGQPKSFKISNAAESHTFVPESIKEFKQWKELLSNICILSNLENDYEILEPIGEGGCSKVFKARLRRTRDLFALKSISKTEIRDNMSLAACATREIICLRKLDHPRIIKLLRIYDNPDSITLVLEYLPGGDLLARLKETQVICEEEVKEFMKGLLEAINYMHSKRVIHRDLKPENILMQGASLTDFRITDFGLAADRDSDDLTLRCGSPGYVAPEILREERYSAKVDVFSAGVVAYVALTKHSPFPGQTAKAILKSNCANLMQFPSILWSGFSRQAVDFIKRLTETNKHDRPSARRALRNPWLKSVSITPTTDGSSQVSPAANLPSGRRMPMVVDLGSLTASDVETLFPTRTQVSSKAISIFAEMTKDSSHLVPTPMLVDHSDSQAKRTKKKKKTDLSSQMEALTFVGKSPGAAFCNKRTL
jgi:serine/threonine protein kinase